jgi:hypothetical protein
VDVVGHEAKGIHVKRPSRTLCSENIQQDSDQLRVCEDGLAMRATQGYEIDVAAYIRGWKEAIAFAPKT